MAILLLRVEGVTIMPSPTQEDDGHPLQERRICLPFKQATLPLKVDGVTIMSFQLRRRMAHPHAEEDLPFLQFEKEGGDILWA